MKIWTHQIRIAIAKSIDVIISLWHCVEFLFLLLWIKFLFVSAHWLYIEWESWALTQNETDESNPISNGKHKNFKEKTNYLVLKWFEFERNYDFV